MVSFALTASSTVLSSLDIFCDATSGTTFAARKMFFGSSSTTSLFCSMDGDVLKMLAAVTVPPVRACTVAGPPPSLIATKLAGAMSSPYFSLSPTRPVTRVWNSDGAPTLTSGECLARSAMDLRFHFCAVASVTARVSLSSAGDGYRIDRSPGSALSSPSSTASGVVAGVFSSKYCKQIAGVLRDEVDGMVLHRRDIGFAAADAELAADGEAVRLQRLGVDLGDDLRFGEVGRADGDRFQIARYLPAAERVGTAACRQHPCDQREHGHQDRQTPSTCARHTQVLSAELAFPDTIDMHAVTPRFSAP